MSAKTSKISPQKLNFFMYSGILLLFVGIIIVGTDTELSKVAELSIFVISIIVAFSLGSLNSQKRK